MNTNSVVYNAIMANAKEVGTKKYATIPLSVLFVDDRFQRIDTASEAKIHKLAAKWDAKKCDAIKVSAHKEDCVFSVIDGYHRMMAAQIRGMDTIECEIINGLPTDPDERLKAEAKIFATQEEEIDHLKAIDMHKANIVSGVRENIELQELVDMFHIKLRKGNCSGNPSQQTLSGFTDALKIIKTSGKDMLYDVFWVIYRIRWDLDKCGLTGYSISTIYDVLRLHKDQKDKVIKVMVDRLAGTTPAHLEAHAKVKYPLRGRKQGMTLYLEDIVCDWLHIQREYKANDKTIKRFSIVV